MENPAFSQDSIQLPPPTEVSPTPKVTTEAVQIQEPIILNPGISSSHSKSSNGRGGLATFGLLLAGWFVGNLLILAALGIGVIGAVGSTGLVKVPVLTSYLFGQDNPLYNSTNQVYYEDAIAKIDEIDSLKDGQSLKKLELSEAEINALLNKQINSVQDFPIGNQSLKLLNDRFVFTGNLVSTNAPVVIVGKVEVDGLTAHVTIDQASFGKVKIPAFLASSIVDNNLSKIGLSLSGSSIPAQSLRIVNGKITLQEVTKPAD